MGDKVRIEEKKILVRGDGEWHHMAYLEYTPTEGNIQRTIVCVHGLTRNCYDFDYAAKILSPRLHARVISVDIVGRGKSDYLKNPAGYGYPAYAADMSALLSHLGEESVDWIGTSMGGLIGLTIASKAGPLNPIKRLILNDIGPFFVSIGISRLLTYVGKDPQFKNVEEADQYFRKILEGFGNLSNEQWRSLAETSVKPLQDGSGYVVHYDPGIAQNFQNMAVADIDLFEHLWNHVEGVNVYVLRGANSDLLLPEIVQRMRESGPGLKGYKEIQGVAHAPALMCPEQVDLLVQFLTE